MNTLYITCLALPTGAARYFLITARSEAEATKLVFQRMDPNERLLYSPHHVEEVCRTPDEVPLMEVHQ